MKTISLDEESYQRLQAHKRDGESFSDVVKRLAGERSWREVAGILTVEDAEELDALIEEGRHGSRGRESRVGWERSDTDDESER